MNHKKLKPISHGLKLAFLASLLVISACHDDATVHDNKNKALIIFNDNNLAQCVNDTGITQQKIVRLDCRGYAIKDIGGIEYLNNLESINLSKNNIVDISPLAVLINRQTTSNKNGDNVTSQLQTLDLSNNQINNASALQSANTIDIDLSNNPLSHLAAPKNIASFVRNGSLVLRWPQTPGARFYHVYMGETKAGINFDKPVAISKVSRVLINNLENDKTYYFQISAIYPQGEGLFSGMLQATPKANSRPPDESKILFMRANDSRIYVDWADVNNADSYHIKLSSSGDFSEQNLITFDNITPPYSITNIAGNQVYSIQIKAKNAIGESLSEIKSITTSPPLQGPQISPLIAIAEENQIQLAWELESKYGSIELFYGTTEDVDESSGLGFANPQSPFLHTGLSPAVTYYYLLLAKDEQGNILRQRASAKPKALLANLLFPDDKLKTCIEDSGFEYVSEITSLNCKGYDIANLNGIEQLDSLEILDLSHNQLTNVSPMANLKRLQELDLQDNRIDDIQALSRLENLTALQLQANQISDISPLQNISQLSSLGLNENPLSDISPLEKLTRLKKLQLANVRITTITPISRLTQLSHLTIANNQVVDITPLNRLQKLEYLDLAGNRIRDFSPLDNLLFLLFFNTSNNNPVINNPPVADAGENQTISGEQTNVTLSAANSRDVDGEIVSYRWQLTANPENANATINNADSLQSTLSVDVKGEYIVQLTVTDDKGASDTTRISINYTGTNPIANAGNDQTFTIGQTVLLDGSLSTDPDGDPLEQYQWQLISRPSGSDARLQDADKTVASLSPDISGEYQIQLTVRAGAEESLPDIVLVSSNNIKPVANAGADQSVKVDANISLDASASFDLDGQPLSFQWTLKEQPTNSTTSLSREDVLRPDLHIDAAGTYVVELRVSDPELQSEIDPLVLTTDNTSPIANAGYDQLTSVNEVVVLDGRNSYDPDKQPLQYQWSLVGKPQDSNATLTDANKMQSLLNIDKAGQYIAQLIVSDGVNNSEPDTTLVSTDRLAPIAQPGADVFASTGETLILDGSASSAVNSNTLAFRWSLISKPEESQSRLINPDTATPSIALDLAGDYLVQLIVNDGLQNSQPENLLISTRNLRPVAIVGNDQRYTAGEMVNLDGSLSFDPNQDPLNFAWSLITQPEFSALRLSDPAAASPVLDTLWEGTYAIQLIVDDGRLTSLPDTLVIEVEPGADDDNDGLNNTLELRFDTDPNNADTDNDGLLDGEEVKKYRTDPNTADSDADSLSDYDEVNTYKTNPNNEDSDGDGWSDYMEVTELNSNPNSRLSTPFLTAIATPYNISALRTGEGDAATFQLNTVMATPDNLNVLRTGEGDATELQLSSVLATPGNINVLRTGEGSRRDLQLNTVIATPDSINILRSGEGLPGDLLLNTIIAEPKNIEVLRPLPLR